MLWKCLEFLKLAYLGVGSDRWLSVAAGELRRGRKVVCVCVCVCECVCVCVCLSVCLSVCVKERDRQTHRQTHRHRERERERFACRRFCSERSEINTTIRQCMTNFVNHPDLPSTLTSQTANASRGSLIWPFDRNSGSGSESLVALTGHRASVSVNETGSQRLTLLTKFHRKTNSIVIDP